MNIQRDTAIAQATLDEFTALSHLVAPRNVFARINLSLEDAGYEATSAEEVSLMICAEASASIITQDEVNRIRVRLQIEAQRLAFIAWKSAVNDGALVDHYLSVLEKIGFNSEQSSSISAIIPGPVEPGSPLTNGQREHWYTHDVQTRNSHYWSTYKNLLLSRPWISSNAIQALDIATTQVVSQLEDPTKAPSFPTRGLVVGHVQSGKTQNFAGVISKAIDAGYRLVIVLTGSTEQLRRQTQRRLDAEIVGVENILNGLTQEENPGQYAEIDYVRAGNPNFPTNFVSHPDALLAAGGAPRIQRFTDSKNDFAEFWNRRAGVIVGDPFRFGEDLDVSIPVQDWENLKNMRVRFVVIKKQKQNLERLIAELHGNRTEQQRSVLSQLAALVIDDEADQASPNTKRPPLTSPEEESEQEQAKSERTAINKLIVQLLEKIPRAQYVAYTATPFANALIDIEDDADLFPKHFVKSLETPEDYCGARHFHDLEELEEGQEGNPENSNKRAFVREFSSEDEDINEEALLKAIDTFVVSGALKLWRLNAGISVDVRHHTMLVHVSHLKQKASEVASHINEVLWPRLGYTSASGLERLRSIYESDIRFVSLSRNIKKATSTGHEIEALPEKFEELLPFLGEAIDRIQSGTDVAMQVNSLDNRVQFDLTSTWAILVGGNLLNRGFTVEGLTVSFYQRLARTMDTLMQMGRWYGYRIGYEDLVRLYLPEKSLWSKATATRPATYINLCDFFTQSAIVDENFRADLAIYGEASPIDGVSRIRPIDLPMLVYKAVPELMPVARNKMHFAELAYAGQGGKGYDLHRVAPAQDGHNRSNFESARPFLTKLLAAESKLFVGIREGEASTQPMRIIDATNAEVLKLIEQMKYSGEYRKEADLALIHKSIDDGGLSDWRIVMQDIRASDWLTIEDTNLPLLNKKRSPVLSGPFSRSNQWARSVIEQISGSPSILTPDLIQARRASNPVLPKTAGLLLSFTRDPGLSDEPSSPIFLDNVATLLSFSLPYAWSPRGSYGYRSAKTKEMLPDHAEHDFIVEVDGQ
jgi:hypothetical protein